MTHSTNSIVKGIGLWFFVLLTSICFPEFVSAQDVTEINSERFNVQVRKPEARLFFEDTAGLYTIEDIISEDLFNQNIEGPKSRTSFYWLKVTLQNTTPYDMEVIALGPRSINTTLYKQVENRFFSAPFGSFKKKSELNKGDERFNVSFVLKAGQPEDIYFRIHGRAFTASFLDAKTFRETQSKSQLQDYLLFGASFILVLYSLVQFVVFRKRMFVWLTLFALGTFMYSFAVRGYFINWFMPEMPKTGLNFSLVWAQLGQLGCLLLTINFLELKQKFPRWHKVFLGLIALMVFRTSYGLYLTAVHEDYGTMTYMGLYTLMVDVLVFKVLLISTWKKVNKSRKVFLVGLVLFGVALIIALITWKYIADFRLVLLYTGSIASLSQVIVFSIALGIQMRQYEVDKNVALDDLNSVLKEQNRKIELQVKKRTKKINEQKKELEVRNDKIETLFKEVHHRVKNNLQLISSLLNMQQEWSSTEDPAKAIEDSRSRVVAMSMIHQFLYRTDDISTIDFRQYAEELASKLDDIQIERVPYHLNINFDREYIFDIDTSISLGLILNELITNSYKHAVGNKQSLRIDLSVTEQSGDYFEMVYKDNGKAIELPFEEIIKKGFGLRLASRLARQLQGKFTYEYMDGNQFSITFASEEARLAIADD